MNRNGNFQWNSGGSSGNPCDVTYMGPSPASEPEVQTYTNYLTRLFLNPPDSDVSRGASGERTGLVISLHSYGDLVLFPWGWTTELPPDFAGLRTLGRKFGFFNGYQVLPAVELYVTSGGEIDWAYGVLGVPAYVFELGNLFFQDCATFTDTILQVNLPALTFAFKAARRPYLAPSAPDTLQLTVLPPGSSTEAWST